MGNLESQNGDHSFYGDSQVHLSRKQMTRSLRISSKSSRRSRHASSGKVEHRHSETSTRSSSTPSIPQSLADNGLEPYNENCTLEGFSSPLWGDQVAMSMRPVSFHDDPLADSNLDFGTVTAATSVSSMQDSKMYHCGTLYLQKTKDGPQGNENIKFKKKRSKSADMWREDSLEFSLSDLSQEHLTSTEDIIDTTDEKDFEDAELFQDDGTTKAKGSMHRANSLNELSGQSNSSTMVNETARFVKCFRSTISQDTNMASVVSDKKLFSPEGESSSYCAYTLPCRRSYCLSENASQFAYSASIQGRRAQTTQDITTEEGSEYTDSVIHGAIPDAYHLSRCSEAMSATYSSDALTEGSICAKSEASSNSEDAVQGVYENFRRELQMSSVNTENLEEAGSAGSDEQTSGTLSSPGQSDILSAAQGTVRKAGALSVKNFLVHKKNKKVELAPRRKWKHYWVSLKGCTLFFYEIDDRSGIDQSSIPKHAVWVENSIVQAVPEHPKKDFVFCLSNVLGDAYLFQTCNQTELENWITAVHSACATEVARQHHKEDTVKMLKAEIKKLEQKIDMDEKMKKMGEMQLSAVSDSKKRKTILEQIFLWEQNLEQFHMELFRFRCYISSLQGGELPNPKRLLAFASRQTKAAMGRLGIFSVSSFHTLVAARTESGVRRRSQVISRSASRRRSRFSSLWGLDTTSKKKLKGRPSINQVFTNSEEPMKKSLEAMFDDVGNCEAENESALNTIGHNNPDNDIWIPDYLTPSWVCLPKDQAVLAVIQPADVPSDILEIICKTYNLDPTKHYLKLKFLINNEERYYIPKGREVISELLYKEIEICPKITNTIHLARNHTSSDCYGFTVSVEEDVGIQRMHVTDVKDNGLSFNQGLKAGDEILELNGKNVNNLHLLDIKTIFSQPSFSMTVFTVPVNTTKCSLTVPPCRLIVDEAYKDIFSQSQENILDDAALSDLENFAKVVEKEEEISDMTHEFKKSTEHVAAFCQSLHDMNLSELSSQSLDSLAHQPVTQRQLTDTDKMRKVICELVETERTYVKDLHCLIEKYLTPLQKEMFLTQDELDVLFGNVQEMVEFQDEFLKTLEDGTRLVPDLEKLENIDQFKKVLFSLGGSFLYYADRFKIYSAFCASHTKVPKVLVKARTDPDFKAFLDAQNPKQQHSATLESYLIKPIQRILKYPLLLKELYSLTDPESEEHYHLDVAMKAMNKVASHINEMQKIHEEYGAVFDQLIAEQTGEKKEVADLSMGDLLLHTTVVWLNPPTSFGKWKKDPELAVFVFKTAVVFIYKDCSKQKKKIGTSHKASFSEERDPFRFRHMISTEALQIRTHASGDTEGGSECDVVHVKSESEGRPERIFHLCCSSPESKKEFLKTIQCIIRDKQRRQLLKTESLPLNQQYIPFGGKRLCALKGARPVMNRAVSAPTRTLGKRKITRNRYTIDVDIAFGSSTTEVSPEQPPKQQTVLGGDTDQWVEEQFDLDRYEDQDEVKETDILSDDEEHGCCSKAFSVDLQDLANIDSTEEDTLKTKASNLQALKMSHLKKQSAVTELLSETESSAEEVIWVKREDFVPTPNSNV
ncbi:T-lymphoma invasion and metastasis-inducing protein 1-like isoform X1 [Polypterus senegalus]|uniref:T-lymphoma invasion and metastasis-inducing protein 1-like isoform X1 n=2 Tax=Polypterus senegalus TaxID=55291 RepID=UPI00196665A6|nr:T-lymphoma invasion and metastasis-inducing protein 1-like isoform X1 [Polypterus senegalus]XP_039600845.1 T-lymphoma invasion and metastasis-inducing protein 1-like isoform X1 [Polypterus senegalus]